MKVIVCGDRNWTNKGTIARELGRLHPEITELIHGCCRGADSLAAEVGVEMGVRVTAIPANWSKEGKGAGPIRNRRMLEHSPDLVIAFHSNIASSKGTKNMIEQANKAGIDVRLFAK